MNSAILPASTLLSDPAALSRQLAGRSPEYATRAAAQEFEAIFAREILKDALPALAGGEGSQGGGFSASLYTDLCRDTLARQMTCGRGLGLAELLVPRPAPSLPSTVTEETRHE